MKQQRDKAQNPSGTGLTFQMEQRASAQQTRLPSPVPPNSSQALSTCPLIPSCDVSHHLISYLVVCPFLLEGALHDEHLFVCLFCFWVFWTHFKRLIPCIISSVEGMHMLLGVQQDNSLEVKHLCFFVDNVPRSSLFFTAATEGVLWLGADSMCALLASLDLSLALLCSYLCTPQPHPYPHTSNPA